MKYFLFFGCLNFICRLRSNTSINLLPHPQPGEETQGIWLADLRGKKGIWQQWLLLGWRTWWHMGFEEDWNKLSQFHVKLFLVSLQCNTLIKLWRVWNIGKLVFSYFRCCCYQASPRGRVYGSTSATKKSILESTLALRTPRYNVHPANTDNRQVPGKNNCFSKIQLVGKKYRDKITWAGKTRFSRHCFGFKADVIRF